MGASEDNNILEQDMPAIAALCFKVRQRKKSSLNSLYLLVHFSKNKQFICVSVEQMDN